MCTLYVSACDCIRGCMDIVRVCTGSWPWDKNPPLQQEIKPASAVCQSDAQLHPHRALVSGLNVLNNHLGQTMALINHQVWSLIRIKKLSQPEPTQKMSWQNSVEMCCVTVRNKLVRLFSMTSLYLAFWVNKKQPKFHVGKNYKTNTLPWSQYI